jgi:3-hydroxyisobutyrate dehydrogenase-like beta-hydroxyacid dehydrogenase
VSAPVFARPDGIAKKQAFFAMSGGNAADRARATELLSSTSPATHDFGDDAGAANVVKLSGNFLIASTIQSLAEALALAENNGLDRVAVSKMLTSTIFNCIIYNGYGQRVSERDHQPGGFSLELGLKDVSLVCDTAFKSKVPMPVASLLRDKWLASYAKGRGDIDWSGVALSTSEDSGVDVAKCLEETMRLAADAKAKNK